MKRVGLGNEMVARVNSRDSIRAAWDGRVESYGKAVEDPLRRGLAVEIELGGFVRALGGGAGLHLLDAGCGVGVHGLRLLEKGNSVVFVDVSPNMLARVGRELEKGGGGSGAEVLELDVRDMNMLGSDSFDGVIAGGTVISDCGGPVEAMCEFGRVLRCGGVLGVSLRNLDGPGQENHCEVVPGGGAGFDWWFFSVTSAAELFQSCGIAFERAYPVMMSRPEPENAEGYVKSHLDATESDKWKAAAWEIFVIGRKE